MLVLRLGLGVESQEAYLGDNIRREGTDGTGLSVVVPRLLRTCIDTFEAGGLTRRRARQSW